MITLENVTFSYSKRRKLFSGLTLSFAPGHIHGLLGANGTGKSTLLNLICGLAFVEGGTVTVQGQHPEHRTPSLLQELFVVPEEFELPGIRFSEYVRVTSPFYPRFSHEDLDRYTQALAVDTNEPLNSISMGQRKKALIAFALACNTTYLIMDEPTNGLDISIKSVFRSLIASWATEQKTVIISTHQVGDIESLIDNVVILDPSGILLNCTTDQITQKLEFRMMQPGEQSLYGEETLQGTYGVVENTSESESKISLELLFNASIKHRQLIHGLFNTFTQKNNRHE